MAHFDLDVDPGAVRAVATRLRHAATTLDARGRAAGRTPGQIGERWTGQAARSVTAEMSALGDRLGESSTRVGEAVDALVTLAEHYRHALDRLPGLNRRWDDAVADHRSALRDIARDQEKANDRGDGPPPSTFERHESESIARGRTSDADGALHREQAALTSTFDDLREELRTATRTAASGLRTALLVHRPVGPVAPGSPAAGGWSQLVRAGLRDQLALVSDHYDAADVDRIPPPDWRTYLEDYGLDVPADIDPERGAELVARLDRQLAAAAGLDAEQRSRALNRWAEGLDPDDLSTLAIFDADRVGNLDGMPNRIRYASNRVNLARGIESEQEKLRTLWDPPPSSDHPLYAEYQRLTRRIAMLEDLQDGGEEGIDPGTQLAVENPSQVLSFELPTYDGRSVTDDGRLAVVIGDLDNADQVGTVVPGITNRIDNFGATLDKARNTQDLVQNSATIAWLGYDTPEFADATSTDDAVTGGQALEDFVDGMVRKADSELTIMAHSYGTLVTSLALQNGMRPDRVVLFGSPGLGEDIRSKADLGVPDDLPIYALRAPGDPVSITAGHGMDPVDMPGIIRLDTDWSGPEDVTGHSQYTDLDTDSLENIAGVLRGWVPGPVDDRGATGLVTGGNPLAEDGLAGRYNQNLRNLVDELQAQVTPEQLAVFTGHLEQTLQNVTEGREIGIDDVPELTGLIREAMEESHLGEHLTQDELQQAIKDAGFTDTTGDIVGDRVREGLDDVDFLDGLTIPIRTRFGNVDLTVPDGLNEAIAAGLGELTSGAVTNLSDYAVDHLPSMSQVLGAADWLYDAYDGTRDVFRAVGMAPEVAQYLLDRTTDEGRELLGDVRDSLTGGLVRGAVAVDDAIDGAVDGGRELLDDAGDVIGDGLDELRDVDLNPLHLL